MTITLRLEKGTELTWEELDGNFQELVAAINEKINSVNGVLPDENGNVEITVESGAFTEDAGRNIVAKLYGTVNSGALDSFCMGNNSSVGGRSNTIVNSWASSIESGFGSIILGGSGAKILGNTYYGTILGGYLNTLSSNESLIMGTHNSITSETINDRNNVAFGRWCDIVAGNAVMTQGIGLKARGTAHLVVGQANEFISHGSNNLNIADAPRFIVGNGTVSGTFQASTRSNAFVVLQNGSVIAPSLTPALIDADTTGKMLITKEYFEANSGGGELSENIVESISLNGGTPVLPVDGNVDLTVESGGRFGVAGEDDVTTANREVLIGANTRIFFDTVNQNAKFEVGSKIDINRWRARHELSNIGLNSYVRYSDDNSHTMISHSGRNINLEAFSYSTGLNHLLGISSTGFWFENGEDTILVPDNKGGYLPLTVNGVAADENGNIEANYIKKPSGVYEDNASALAGGLSVDDTYRTADGTIKIVF